MATNRDFTLKRKNGDNIDILYPTTRWAQVEEKPTTFTPTAHSHGNITNGGAIGTTANLIVKTGTSGKLTTLSAGLTSQFLRGDGTWATPADATTLTSLGITATSTELNYTKGVTSGIQTQLDGKANDDEVVKLTTSGDTMQEIASRIDISNTSIPFYSTRKTTANGGIYATAMFTREITTGTPADGNGPGVYFRASSSTKAITHAGIFGGRLAVATQGAEVGEIVFGPAWRGADPYQRADFRVRARSASIADAYINGKFYAENTKEVATQEWVTGNTRSSSWVPTWSQVTDKPSVIIEGDSRLTNARTPTAHTHGSITNDGRFGTAAGRVIVTGTNGKLEAATTIGIDKVSGLQNALAGKSNTGHEHTKSDITDFAHTHTKSDITDFAHTHGSITNDGRFGTAAGRVIVTGTNGKLEAATTIGIDKVSGLQNALAGKSNTGHEHTKSDITDFAHTHTKSDITDFAHTHGSITNDGRFGTAAGRVIVTGTNGKLEAATTIGIDKVSGLQTQLNSKAEPWKLIRGTEFSIPTTITANNVTVISGNYYGKTLAFEVRVNTNNDTYETHIVFASMGSNTSVETSATYDRFYSWTAFDGRYLKTHSFKAYCSNAASTTITVGAMKHLVGSFQGNTIEWTTPTITTYIERIWLVN